MPATKTTITARRRPVLLLVTLTLLVAAVRSEPFDYVDVTQLKTVADNLGGLWSTARSGQVKIWLRPYGVPSSWSDDNRTTVCGYKFTAASTGDPAAVVSDTRHLPATTTFRCDGRDKYRVHLAAGGGHDDDNAFAGEYSGIVSLGAGAHVHAVRLEAAGITAVPLEYLCFGFLGDDGAGAVRTFCADVSLLNACRRVNESPDVHFGTVRHIQLGARRRFWCREIVFRDVHGLVRGFEALASHRDDQAVQRAFCERISFVDSDDPRSTLEGCLGQSVDERAASESTERQFAFINPERFADVDSSYERCERLNDDTSATEHVSAAEVGGGVLQTSSGQRISSSFSGFLLLSFSGFLLLRNSLESVAV